MHEMSIVQALLEQVQSEVEKSGHDGRVMALHLVIGRLSGVHVESIRFAFELLGPDSIARDAELVIDEPKAELACRNCHSRHAIDELHANCPACGSDDVAITGGQQLLLQSIELEDEA
jgi:hydrogenase nickel incorporation protein HypA/HybF